MIQVWVVVCNDGRIHQEYEYEPSPEAAQELWDGIEQEDSWPCGPHRIAMLEEKE